MDLKFSLCLPRDEATVPVVRHVCRDALLKLGVDDDCVSDVELAVTEACSNVLHHVEATDQYEVTIDINDTRCEIRVIDAGAGFDHAEVGLHSSSYSAESGRGVFLMRSVVDELNFVSEPESGTVVRLVKHLVLKESSPLKRMAAGKPISADSREGS